MSSVNKVILVGRLGKDPESREISSGSRVTTFSMVTSKTWKDKSTGDKKESSTWHNIVLWRGLAEVAAKYLHKGDQVYIEGEITSRSYEKDGVTKYVTEILGNELVMLSSKNSGQSKPNASNDFSSNASDGPKDDTDATDDLPF